MYLHVAKWAHHRSHLAQLPEIRMPGARVLGHSDESARKSAFLVFTAKEIAAIIAKLPEFATVNSSGERFSVRTRFVGLLQSPAIRNCGGILAVKALAKSGTKRLRGRSQKKPPMSVG